METRYRVWGWDFRASMRIADKEVEVKYVGYHIFENELEKSFN